MSDLHTAPRLETERLILRAWRVDDVEPFIAMMADSEVAAFLTTTQQKLDRTAAWSALAVIVGHWALRGHGLFAVQEKQTGAFIGRVGAWAPEGRAELELGWGLARAAWGKGYAAEAAVAAGDWMFATLGPARLSSLIHPANARSQKLAAKLGFRAEAETYHAGALHQIWRAHRDQWARQSGKQALG